MRYGQRHLKVKVPSKNILSTYMPRFLPKLKNDHKAIITSIREPIGTDPLESHVKKGMKVSILVSDITRPCPSYKILPPIVSELKKVGIEDDDLEVIFATGMHRKHKLREQISLVGDGVVRQLRIKDHYAKDKAHMEYVGRTKRGTEVHINKDVIDSDFSIGVANIDIHYFAGYSGGAKSLLPGVSSFDTIQQNHSLMFLPDSKPGKADGNPVREDIEEACQMTNFRFIVNVVLNERKEIVNVVAGDPVKAHRSGILSCDYMYKTHMDEEADIVIASVGGFPRDINLYQAQKGLENAGHAVKKGGTIILLAECAEGFGDKMFAQTLFESKHPDDVIEKISKNFVLGGHKAFAIARLAKKAEIVLISNIPDDLVEKAFMKPAKKIGKTIRQALATHGSDATIALMPYASSTLPYTDA
jgi:nickel-dependent lactate racemase